MPYAATGGNRIVEPKLTRCWLCRPGDLILSSFSAKDGVAIVAILRKT